MKHALLVLCTAAALYGAAACPARAEDGDSLPPGTVTSTGFPRFVPDGDDEAFVRRWCESALAYAESQGSTPTAAHLEMSAAWALGHTLARKKRAASLMEAAAARFPPGEAMAGAAWLEAARFHLNGEDLDGAERALAASRAYLHARAPVDAPEAVLRQWEAMRERLARAVPRVAVALAEARGAYDAAAAELEAAAEARERAGRKADETAAMWARAARLRARATETEKALADVDRALALVRDEEKLAHWSMWRVYCEHGCLDDEGAPGLRAAWPGEAFVEDAYAALRALHGNPHAARTLLSLGSRALLAGQPEASLGFYRIALNDPVLLEAARENENLWRGLLAAYPVAMQVGAFAEAHRILDVVEGTGAVSREEIDEHRLAIARGEEAHAAETSAGDRPEETVPGPEEGGRDPSSPLDHPDRGRLRPKTPDEAPGRTGTTGERDATGGAGWGRLGGAAALVLLLVLVLGAVARHRR